MAKQKRKPKSKPKIRVTVAVVLELQAQVVDLKRQLRAARTNAETWQRDAGYWRCEYEKSRDLLYATRDAVAVLMSAIPKSRRADAKIRFEDSVKLKSPLNER